ncbi:nuclear pore complex protein Nup98-Nup96 isoform X2 [Coccinella septempunctata]|uniref:nuclear pore complex protein Nup98-Nup96 isoform X2 n=1 Tax=Coccinella septempunctata TaxID=41139 RepID=UPI001D063DEB|nr:nuclear pore complex protein Nup98-Nup96 isoform X2 [Coccinella septempunctata]
MFSNLNKSTFGTSAPSTSFGLGASTSNTTSPWGSTGNNQLFGKPATPAFGQPASTSFGQPSTSSNSMFPFFSQSNTSGFGSGTSNQSTFGSNVFGQQPATTNLFGSNTFGQQKPTGFGFGTQNQQQPNLFGQSAQPQSSLFQTSGTSNLFSGGGAFGSTSTTMGTGTTIKFTPVTGTDTMQKGGVTTSINTKHHCITCMKEYENKSFEELRLEDYQANRKGPQSQFTSTPFGGTSSMFGQTTENKPAFAQPTGFGQIGGGTTFGQQTTGFGLNTQPSTSNSIFGKPPAFGATSSTTTTFGGFNTPATTSAFGTNQNKTFGGTGTTSLFGTTQTQQQSTPFGSNMFGQNNQLSKPVFGGLGQTSTASTFGQTPAFGQNTQQNNFGSNTFGKPLTFGQNQNTFQLGGQPNLFANNQQKSGSLLGSGGGLFGNNIFGSNTSSNFPLLQTSTQAAGQGLSTDSNQEPKALPLFATNQFGHTPFLKGLLPVDKPSSPTLYTTNPIEIKKMLENNKKVDENTSIKVKLKLGPPKTQKNNLFEEGTDEDSNKLYKTSCKRLVLKKKQDDSKHSIFENNSLCNDLSLKESDLSQGNDVSNLNGVNNSNLEGDRSFVLGLTEKQKTELKNINDKFALRKNFDWSLNMNGSVNESINTIYSNKNDGSMGDVSNGFEVPRKNTSDIDLTTNEAENENTRSPLSLRITSEISPNDTPLDQATKKVGPCGIILNRSEYYTLPSIEDLDNMVGEDGRCMIRGFTIGRRGYGNVYFPDEINVMNMNLDEIVHFRYKEIHMYPDETKKPPVGEGLNRRAQVTLDRVYPRMKETKEIIDNVDQVLAAKFPEQLVEISAKHGLKFVDYRPETGSWVFMVEHFSKYAFTESDEEDCELIVSNQNKTLTAKDRLNVFSEKKGLQSTDKTQMETDLVGDSMNGDLASEYTDEGDQRQGDLLHKSMTIDMEGQEEDFLNPIYEPSDTDIFYHNSHIQVLKAAFFSESECASTISSVDNYSPYKTDILEVKAKPLHRKPPQRPKVWKIYLSIASRPNDSVLLNASRCYSDFGLYKGKSYKVGWCNGFKNYTVKLPRPSEFEASLSLTLNTISTTSIDESLMDAITDCMKIAQNCSSMTMEGEEGIPTFQIIKDRTYLISCHEIFQKASNASGKSHFLYKDVWSLCHALWGPGRTTAPFVKSRLSSWLQTSIEDKVPKNKLNQDNTTENKLDIIFNQLSCFDIVEASKIAMEADMPILALIISQINLTKRLKAQIRHQVQCWYKDMFVDHINPEIMKIYLLLSGDTSSQDIDIFEGLEWKRAFGLYLWYLTSDGCPLQEAIAAYTNGFSKGNGAVEPKPSYNCGEDNICYDILYHILLLYKNNTYRLVKALHPETHTPVKTDFRLSWLLMLFFQSINVGLIDDFEVTHLHISFSSQLEENGLWDFAILPLLYLKNNSLKKNLIMGILNRNLSIDNDAEIEKKLVEHLHVPAVWIDNVKSWKSNSSVVSR